MHRSLLRAMALLLAGGLCACAYPGGYQAWLNQFAAPARGNSSLSSRSRQNERTRIARLHSHRHEPDYVRTVNVTAPPENIPIDQATPPPASISKPHATLTLAGDSRDRERAQALLHKTDTTLQQARQRPLTDVQRDNYQRASQLAGWARRALATNDNAAASSLAVKAWALSAGMNGR